jgi:hypothetical protein
VLSGRGDRRQPGQALAEFALVFPIFAMAFFGVIVFGLSVFYQQQLTNAAREGARYAAVRSTEHPRCPIVSNLEPAAPPPLSYYRCDAPADGWPALSSYMRGRATGVGGNGMHISACWSSYHDDAAPTTTYDYPPQDPDGSVNVFIPCKYAKAENNPSLLACPPGPTTTIEDTGSNAPDNRVTVYACFNWTPPMAGFLLIPQQWTMRAVVTEVIHHQQS